jgi:hypothetical protein
MRLVLVRLASYVRSVGLAIGLVIATAVLVHAQDPTPQAAAIEGTVSTQGGSVKLPGALVSIRNVSGAELAPQVSDEQGQFRFANLPPGRYRVRASLEGFQAVETVAIVASEGVARPSLDLPIAAVSENVEVVATSPVSASGMLATSDTVDNRETQLMVPGEGFQSAIRLLAGVLEVPGGESIDGGRPNQAGFQIGAATLSETATNFTRLPLPADAIESVSVLPNPYEVEFGRFSSGLVVVQTRRAGDQWKVRLNNVEPAFRLKRYTLFDVKGIASLKPSLEFGGPLVKDRVLLEESAQYHYQATDIPSRPESELRTSQWFSSFSRIDARLSSRHSLVFTGGLAPSGTKHATLGTFTPPEATATISDRVDHAMLTERSLWNDATVVETMVQFHEYRTTVRGRGSSPMELLPETTLGDFFNRQHRESSAFQWTETASSSRQTIGGQHLFKIGFDLLHSGYEGTSLSGPVLVERSNGTLVRRLDFVGPTAQAAHGTDVAVFAQDRLQPSMRWYVELGGRVDHDGMTGHSNVTPRVGMALLVNSSATAVLHGGYGFFVERTPSVAGAFDQFQSALDTRIGTDGVTPLGPSVLYQHVIASDLRAARSTAWDIAYDYRVNRLLALHLSVLNRHGSHELIVNPIGTQSGGELLLSSAGRSDYRQEQVAIHAARGSRVDMTASYVHASAHENLNSLMAFFDNVLEPVIGQDAYAPAVADVPNRFFVRGRTMPTARWLLLGTVDWRTGLPYSIVNEALEFVGARNVQRFPTYFRTEMAVERRVAIARWQPWLGLRVTNALNSFLPADVQSNLGSPAFGSFFNSEYRQFRIHMRFEK